MVAERHDLVRKISGTHKPKKTVQEIDASRGDWKKELKASLRSRVDLMNEARDTLLEGVPKFPMRKHLPDLLGRLELINRTLEEARSARKSDEMAGKQISEHMPRIHGAMMALSQVEGHIIGIHEANFLRGSKFLKGLDVGLGGIPSLSVTQMGDLRDESVDRVAEMKKREKEIEHFEMVGAHSALSRIDDMWGAKVRQGAHNALMQSHGFVREGKVVDKIPHSTENLKWLINQWGKVARYGSAAANRGAHPQSLAADDVLRHIEKVAKRSGWSIEEFEDELLIKGPPPIE